ncbi:hypothetical protein D9758_000073 [Tetrapyrgos nigripes]|uniref:RING-type domain-containing protein n=1 Tax=Tetrapyrgos nigripes TaxID=182062 RepID=A0A8H5H167_9AGAR|nr:hypothetical protein D9758_000073 [Tetrapyrgos nigripes]
MASYSEDEFDAIIEAIGDAEWNALTSQIPGGSGPGRDLERPRADQALSQHEEFEEGSSSPSSRSSETAATNSTHSAPVMRRSPSESSSAYFSEDEDDMDSLFLEQLDRLEREVLDAMEASSQPPHEQSHIPSETTNNHSHTHDSHSHPQRYTPHHNNPDPKPKPLPLLSTVNPVTSSPKRPRSCSDSSDDGVLLNKKGKTKAIGDIEELMEGFLEEVTCPICFDVLVGASLINPCGHTLCGPCGYAWVTLKKQTTCPVCRAKCCHFKPLISNIMVDNMIEKHIEIQAARGDVDWAIGGVKWKERHERLEKWKKNVNYTRGVPRRLPVNMLPTEPPANVVDPDILFGIRAMHSANDYGPRSIFDIFAA